MEVHFLFWYDFFLLPIYLIAAIIFLNRYFKKRHGHNQKLKKHFNRGVILKLLGCISIALIYEYYYKGAYDGVSYFEGAKMLVSYWGKYPQEFFNVLFSNVTQFNSTNLAGISTADVNIYANESFTVSKIAAVFTIFSFKAFLPCSIFFCVFAFIGLWRFFIFLIEEFQLPLKLAAVCTIYIPSVLIWDSGIFKDTITFTALLWMFMCGYYLFLKPRKIFANVVGFAVCAFLIATVKVYILAAFAPCFILYIFNVYKARLKSEALRFIATPFIIAVSAVLILFFLQNADELLGRYSADQILETATSTYAGINSIGQAGSAYSIKVDFSSPFGLIKAIPAGINITLFRPYPWEYLKPFILLASAESMIMLYFTVFVVIKIGLGKIIRAVSKSPILQFCFFFSLLFAFMVGISSANFGSLVRYKIPCLPFYVLFLSLLYTYRYPAKQVAVVKSSASLKPGLSSTL